MGLLDPYRRLPTRVRSIISLTVKAVITVGGFYLLLTHKVDGGEGVGRIPIAHLIVQNTGSKLQNSCTNSPPVAIINPGILPVDDTVGLLKYDVVFDYDNDGYYDIGRDMLDVVGHSNSGKAFSAKDLENLDDDQIFGFAVTK